MGIEQLSIRVRERGRLEILDLAVIVLRRHWAGLSSCLAVGAGPCLAFNLWWSQDFGDEPLLYLFLVFMQAPWATLWITLYLGQITFLRRVSRSKLVRDALGSLWQMFFFQTFVRGLCVLFGMFLLPPVYLLYRMHYASEIILLERSRWTRAVRRIDQFHRNLAGQRTAELVGNGVLFLFLFLVLSQGLISFSELMFSRSDQGWAPILDAADDRDALSLELVRPEAQIALWLVIGFFAVVRYLSYLDCRIRREGWEVEVRLMAEGARLTREAW